MTSASARRASLTLTAREEPRRTESGGDLRLGLGLHLVGAVAGVVLRPRNHDSIQMLTKQGTR